jgi:SAM-dependent methyltransferase
MNVLLGREVSFPVNKNKSCPVCNSKKTYFLPISNYFINIWQKYGYVYSIFDAETLNVNEYSCAICGASDRERLYALYLRNNKTLLDNKSILDIGFSPIIKKFIINNLKNVRYSTLDKYNKEADFQFDVEKMNEIEDNSYDFIICSHVLEHVNNPINAVREIYRILKNKGEAIIMVPILLSLENTIENSEYNTDELRWKYYGQNDHLRNFSKKDFVNLLKNASFEVKELNIDYFGKKDFEQNGIIEKSVLYLCVKNE